MGIIFFIGGIMCMVVISQLALGLINTFESLQRVEAKLALFGVFNIGVSYFLPILTTDLFFQTESQEFFTNISTALLVIGVLCLVSSFMSLFIKTKETV